MDEFPDIPYFDSFQRGRRIRSSEPIRAAWRYVAKLGTSDRLAKVAKAKGHDETIARPASIRVRQALELWESSKGTSILTRPLLLYYAMLNLSRGVMLAYLGEFGARSHGLTFRSGGTLLDCSAIVGKKAEGTFPRFAKSLGANVLGGTEFTLRNLLAGIPELLPDHHLLQSGPPCIVRVRVDAVIDGPMRLHFRLHQSDVDSFKEDWASKFPWFKDICAYEKDTTLRVITTPADANEIAAFCKKHLVHDLRRMDEADWYDDIRRDGNLPPARVLRYLAAMFILSNVARYEPDFLEGPTTGLTDMGYALESFLDIAERFFPQLIAEVLERRSVFFE